MKFQKILLPKNLLMTCLSMAICCTSMSQNRDSIQELEEILRSHPEKNDSDALARVQSLKNYIEHHQGTEESMTASLIYAADLIFLGFSTPEDSRVDQGRKIFEEVLKGGGNSWQHAYAAVGVIASYDYQGTENTKEDTERQISIAIESLRDRLFDRLDEQSNKSLKAFKIWSPETSRQNAIKTVYEFTKKGYDRLGKDTEELKDLIDAQFNSKMPDLIYQTPNNLPENQEAQHGAGAPESECLRSDSKRDTELWRRPLVLAGGAALALGMLILLVWVLLRARVS